MEGDLGSLILIRWRRGTERGVRSISSANGYKIACLASQVKSDSWNCAHVWQVRGLNYNDNKAK